MKKVLLLALILANVTVFGQTQDSAVMGASYANDVYYSFSNGTVKTVARDNWHMAFTTKIVDASIRINDGLGVELFIASTDTSDWNSIDTTGMTWDGKHNSLATWTEGAFNDGAGGHPDYGWGTYNNVTHNVYGTKIYVMKLPNGSIKKVMIRSMVTTGDFTFRLADLDGMNEVNRTVNKMDYSQKNFFYYDAVNDTVLDREPAKADWDLLFSRYTAEVAPTVWYPVAGVLINENVKAAKATGVDVMTVDWNNYPTTDSISTIGSDWKTFNNGTFSYDVDDSTAFFVESQDGNLYKLVFTAFRGSANGTSVFAYSIASGIGIAEFKEAVVNVFPNPATDVLFVDVETASTANIYTINGALVKTLALSEGRNRFEIAGLAKGLYLMRIENGIQTSIVKVVVQ